MSTSRQTKADVVGDFRRSQILDAARRSFIDKGLSGTTVDGIARTAGVAKGTVYLYYRSKDEILRQLLAADLAELEADTLPCITSSGTVEERLKRFFTATLAFFDRKRDFVEQCHLDMSPELKKKTLQQYQRVYDAQRAAWRTVLTTAASPRRTRAADVDATALSLVALAHGVSRQRLLGWISTPIATLAAQTSAFALKGLAGR